MVLPAIRRLSHCDDEAANAHRFQVFPLSGNSVLKGDDGIASHPIAFAPVFAFVRMRRDGGWHMRSMTRKCCIPFRSGRLVPMLPSREGFAHALPASTIRAFATLVDFATGVGAGEPFQIGCMTTIRDKTRRQAPP